MHEALGLISSTGKNKLVLYKHEENDQSQCRTWRSLNIPVLQLEMFIQGVSLHGVCCVHVPMGEREQMCSETPQRCTIVTQSGVCEPATPSSGGLL